MASEDVNAVLDDLFTVFEEEGYNFENDMDIDLDDYGGVAVVYIPIDQFEEMVEEGDSTEVIEEEPAEEIEATPVDVEVTPIEVALEEDEETEGILL